MGQDDRYNSKLTRGEYQDLERNANDILIEMKIRFPLLREEIDFFTMETCLCSFKKIFRENHGRYLGYYLDRQSEEIQQAEKDGWYGIDWNVLWQARNETLEPSLAGVSNINKEMFTSYLNSGRISKLEWMFDDEKPVTTGLEAFYA